MRTATVLTEMSFCAVAYSPHAVYRIGTVALTPEEFAKLPYREQKRLWASFNRAEKEMFVSGLANLDEQEPTKAAPTSLKSEAASFWASVFWVTCTVGALGMLIAYRLNNPPTQDDIKRERLQSEYSALQAEKALLNDLLRRHAEAGIAKPSEQVQKMVESWASRAGKLTAEKQEFEANRKSSR